MLSRLFIFFMESISNQHVDYVESIYCRAAAAFTSMLSFAYKKCAWRLCEKAVLGRMMSYWRSILQVGQASRRNFRYSMPNGLKQALLRPAHDWPMDGTLQFIHPTVSNSRSLENKFLYPKGLESFQSEKQNDFFFQINRYFMISPPSEKSGSPAKVQLL